MNLVGKVIFVSSFLVAQSVYAVTVCEKFALDLGRPLETVAPLSPSLTSAEKAMIQMTVLYANTEKPIVDFADALAVFADIRPNGEVGSLGGQIEYFSVGRSRVAKVAFYPGDNTYGLIFNVFQYGEFTNPMIVGTIADDSISCLMSAPSRDE